MSEKPGASTRPETTLKVSRDIGERGDDCCSLIGRELSESLLIGRDSGRGFGQFGLVIIALPLKCNIGFPGTESLF